MKTVILSAIGLLALAGSAHAGIPFVNATCPGNIEVHADEGGPIYVNGKELKNDAFASEQAFKDAITNPQQ